MDVNDIQAGEDNDGDASSSKNAFVACLVSSAFLLVAVVVACYCRVVHKKSQASRDYGAWDLQLQEDMETDESKKNDYELEVGDKTGSRTTFAPAPTLDASTSEEIATVADAADQHHGDREIGILTPDETWRKANFFFPGLLKGVTLRTVEGKHMRRRYSRCTSLNAAIHTELIQNMNRKLGELGSNIDNDQERRVEFERLMNHENAAELCIALGMNEAVVRLRFKLIRNFATDLDIPVGKTHILHSIQHLIDTIYASNPFGEDCDIDTNEICSHYRGKSWLSYLGVHWTPGEIVEPVERVEQILDLHIQNDFYAHGTTGWGLDALLDGDLVPSVSTKKLGHDFGTGFYCFKNEIRCALSFAVDRCWPVAEDPDNEGIAIVKNTNPALVLFPKPNQADINKYSFEVDRNSKKPLNEKDLKTLKPKFHSETAYTEFIDARKKWEGDKTLGYWKDYVKLSLCYHIDLTAGQGHRVVYGLMHNSDEGKRPLRTKVPVPDKDGWVQYCFKEEFAHELLKPDYQMVFVEFCVEWSDWFKLQGGTDIATADILFEETEQEIEKGIKKPVKKRDSKK